jgi:hypothetical protein
MAENEPPASEPPEIPLPPSADPRARCPWCSAPVEAADAVTCSACGATLHGDAEIEIPGVTALDSQHTSRALAPRKGRRTFGALFVSGDDPIPQPSEAELPALALPDADVRREMLRIRLDAELADLTARVEALAAERGLPMPITSEPGATPETETGAETEPNGEAELEHAPGQAGEPRNDASPSGGDAGP